MQSLHINLGQGQMRRSRWSLAPRCRRAR